MKPAPSSHPAPAGVLLVEDDPETARRLAEELALGGRFQCVAAAADLPAALVAARRHRPPLVLYDLHLGGAFRPEGIAAIKDLSPDSRLLVLTHYEDDEPLFQALRHGADGYVLKGDAALSLERALALVQADEAPLSRAVARRILRHFHPPRTPDGRSAAVRLTARQRQVVEMICEGRLNKEIADALGISADAVKQHIAAIKSKLRVRTRAEIGALAARGLAP